MRLVQRLSRRLVATKTLSDALEVLGRERARGEEGRTRLLLEALWVNDDPLFREDLLNRLLDTPRPTRPPYVDLELGLEESPPALSSVAAPGALSNLGEALSGEGLVPDLLQQARAFTDSGEFLEAAGVLSLTQEVLKKEPLPDSGLQAAWSHLSHHRRCVARYVDAARPSLRRFPKENPLVSSLSPERMVEAALAADPGDLPCVVLAIQMLSTQAQKSTTATWAAATLLSPHLVQTHYASANPLLVNRAEPRPAVRGSPQEARRILQQGVGDFLLLYPDETVRLLPLLSRGPDIPLLRDRREEVALGLLFYAPPQADAAAQVTWAYRHHNPLLAADPLHYIDYLGQLGSSRATSASLTEALRDPQAEVLVHVVELLARYPYQAVDAALSPAPPPTVASLAPNPNDVALDETESARAVERRQIHERTLALRALFRLPLWPAPPDEQKDARETALRLHHCCRGVKGACDRLSVERIRACPVWTPLRWW